MLILLKNDCDKKKAMQTASRLVKYFTEKTKDKSLFTIKCTSILKRSGVKDNKLIVDIIDHYREFCKTSKGLLRLKNREVWEEIDAKNKKFLDEIFEKK
jgi:hypothetical protein